MDRMFEGDRALLDRQYDCVCYDPETGLSRDELRAEAGALEERLSGEAPIRVKAALFKLTLENARIHVDEFDWIADHIDYGDTLSDLRGRQWMDSGLKAIGAPVDPLAESGLLTAGLDISHTSPDWARLLALGLYGLQSAAETRREQLAAENALTTRRRDFLDSVIMVYGAMRTLCRRLSAQAGKEAARHPGDAERLRAVSAALERIADHPPQTLHEAMQLAYIYHECQEFEGEPVRSMGGFDRLYSRFYEGDLAAGRLTRDQAKELIKYFFNKFYARTQDRANGKNFYFGGELPDGESAVNDLSYLALEAYREMRTVNPKLSVRVSDNTPQDFVALAADCIRDGCSGIVFCNDRSIIETMMKFGKTREDARRYVPIGCYEPAAEGLEMNRSVSATVNLPKLVELALNDGFDPVYGRQSGP
ncbi:MAG: pyruvate formate lyase family protein, partial [Clostridiales bacterium]|nr:pyruvate formate lyase family protein [Clostridiales bacterium]